MEKDREIISELNKKMDELEIEISRATSQKRINDLKKYHSKVKKARNKIFNHIVEKDIVISRIKDEVMHCNPVTVDDYIVTINTIIASMDSYFYGKMLDELDKRNIHVEIE